MGSSTTVVSVRCRNEYISAVDMFRGPDQQLIRSVIG